MSSQAVSSGIQVDVSLNSAFASRKRNTEEERSGQPSMLPSHFQVYTKIDEETRKDNKLVISFLLTLNDTKGLVTYEFRGICTVTGTSADFEAVMETNKNSRVPKILDILYQKLYPAMFMLAGMTTASYPQSVALLTDMMSSEPIPVRHEVAAAEETPRESKVESAAAAVQKEIKPSISKPIPSSRPPGLKPFKPKAAPMEQKVSSETGKSETAKSTV
ncbi:MAG: hypothetical protein MN733_11515 [Nitrososphaera sp.]|nr:hypothetical protein [Nitrososphaera sp.]